MDAAGNVTARGSDTFTFDQANRLTSATVNAITTTYAYDGDGVRVSRTQNPQTTSYVHDRQGTVPVVIDDGARRYILGPSGLAYSLDSAGAATGYHTDALRSTRALSDAGAALLQRYQRDAWGNPTVSQGTSNQPFGFTGELNDASTGLLHVGAREYDPATGRFMQRDTVLGATTSPITLHRYLYAADSPITQRDPSGRCAILCGAVIGAAVGAGVSLVTYSAATIGNGTWTWQDAAKATGVGLVAGAVAGALLPLTLVGGGSFATSWAVNGSIGAVLAGGLRGSRRNRH